MVAARIAVAMVLLSGILACGPPSDEELREQFLEQRQALEAMIALFKQDMRLHCVAADFYTLASPDNSYRHEPSSAMSERRWEQFRALMLKAGVSRACDVRVEHGGRDYFSFLVSSGGTVFQSSYTSIEYVDPSVTRRQSRGRSRYTPLVDNWYIDRYSD